MDLSIVSGTYNRLPYLKKMVASCRQSVGGLSYEIILVDGGSTDGTIQWCKEQEDVKLIEQGELLGAIKAFNAGCFAAAGRYVAILNDDIEVVGDSLQRACAFLEANSQVAQVAFQNDVRGTGDKKRQPLSKAFGLLYGQCSVTQRELGDLAGWWGDEGMKTYGGDTRLSLRLWELGYPTVHVEGCTIIDHVAEDELRKTNSDDPWNHARARGTIHPDLARFAMHWNNRLPKAHEVIPAMGLVERVIEKARRGNLRTIRFKGMMAAHHRMRHSLIDIFDELGEAKQVNQSQLLRDAKNKSGRFQEIASKIVLDFEPDLVILQAQRRNNFMPETIWKLRERLPWAYFVNFDGDVHYPLTDFQFGIAQSVHLQCVPSPTLFPEYAAHNIGVAYWPIGIEEEYIVDRAKQVNGPDVVFLGALYGHGVFPEAENREQAVRTLWGMRDEIDFLLLGNGWKKIGLEVGQTNEQHGANARLYARSKLALSISQASELWGYTSDRLYNICATGCPALVQRFAGMEAHGFVDGVSCIAWSSFSEMSDKVRYYLDHPEEREEIGARGKDVVLSRHTWKHRVDSLFTMMQGFRR